MKRLLTICFTCSTQKCPKSSCRDALDGRQLLPVIRSVAKRETLWHALAVEKWGTGPLFTMLKMPLKQLFSS